MYDDRDMQLRQVITSMHWWYVINGGPSTRAEVKEEIQMYWPFLDDPAVIDGIVMKDRRIIVPASLQQIAIEQLSIKNIGID